MPEERLDGAVLSINGQPLPTELYARLLLVRVEESVHLPDAFEIRFEDAHFRLFDDAKFNLGHRVEIAMRADSEPIVITSGEITAITVDQGDTGRHELVLSGFDLTHRLAQAPKRRSFQRMSYADIAGLIAGEHSLQADIDSSGQVQQYVLQANETDVAFLRRLAARTGFDVWITGQTLHFKRKPHSEAQPPSLRWGESLLRFKVRFSMRERCDEVLVRGWDPLGKKVVTGTADQVDYGSNAPAAAEMAQASRAAVGWVQRCATSFPVADQTEAKALASSLLLRSSGEEVQLRGEAQGNPMIGAGAEIQIDGVGSRLAGKYRTTAVTHLFGTGRAYRTTFVCGGKEPNGLPDLLGGAGARPMGAPAHLMVGQVTNNNDPEQLCRVKVKFPSLSEDDESTWARLASPGAGARRGLQWVPEVNDEVLVGFELGDMTRPIVLGGLWSRTDQPPDPKQLSAGSVQGRLLVSRKDHRLSLLDDPTSVAELSLGDSSSRLHLEKSSSSLDGEEKLVLSGRQIEIRASDSLSISAARISLTATGDVSVSGQPIKLN
jgi:uncharacterized protein involved in type VI secretion and phage assembly